MQPDAEADRAPSCSASPRIQSIFCLTCSGGSPQVRYTSTFRAATGPAAADEPPKKISGSGSGGSAVSPPSTW